MQWRQPIAEIQQQVTEDYFRQSICLYDRAKHGNEMMVASGSHSYPFSVAVPLQVPSSLRGRYGSIDYVAIATLERLWQPNETVSKAMKITSVLDLNTLPYHVLEPMESHKAQRCGFMCFCSGDICATLRLSRAAFIPGEVIRLNGEVANNCGLRLKRTSFQLIQTVSCHDEYGRSSVDEHSVALVEKVEGVPSGSVEFWREQMKVPTVPPSGQKYCNAMDLGYSLRFTASTFFSPVAMEMDIEIVIGTVALNEPENIETNFYGEYFTSSYPDFNSTGSASPITGSDNSGLDLTYFI
ncbi:hypothetical protein CAPTEDRAFT_219161 [Capitella teleta]|uniref:Arrestin C-terminal-like domain-containing protein n=1 Tax=Capitella teleta TaxID=283909 RepID=R7TDS5_CAPTE|nr:hypothetical protein CAPTEDRAFT_219161 [Capitella teleta]|eukprot:ELT89216.1 hypothetical protein CAPTEDRAFT_219161 [Capitella teleta]